jgi:hypothetical protein
MNRIFDWLDEYQIYYMLMQPKFEYFVRAKEAADATSYLPSEYMFEDDYQYSLVCLKILNEKSGIVSLHSITEELAAILFQQIVKLWIHAFKQRIPICRDLLKKFQIVSNDPLFVHLIDEPNAFVLYTEQFTFAAAALDALERGRLKCGSYLNESWADCFSSLAPRFKELTTAIFKMANIIEKAEGKTEATRKSGRDGWDFRTKILAAVFAGCALIVATLTLLLGSGLFKPKNDAETGTVSSFDETSSFSESSEFRKVHASGAKKPG